MLITDVTKLRKGIFDKDWIIPDEYLVPQGYSVLDPKEPLGMKSIGRIYYQPARNLDYVSGEPVELPYIDGGEVGVTDRYMKAGAKVYTEEQVKNLLQSRAYEVNEDLKPKLPEDVYGFLSEVSNNKAKDKPKRAKELLNKYKLVGVTAKDDDLG